LGYAENLNRILLASQARYVLLMNTDMLFDPAEQCLTKAVQFMDAHPECGVCSPRIYRYDGSYAFPARRYPTWQTAVGRRFGENRFFRRNLSRYFYLDRDPYATQSCDWLTGCFLLARREAVQKVGPLDEGFRKYFEDVDWCARMNAAGYRVMLCGDTYCFHAEQRASKRVFSVDGRQHLQSYARWIWKYLRGTPQAVEAVSESQREVSAVRRLPIDGDFAAPDSTLPIHRAA
jgi:N-acetylglucosaminyl-diphospho-decaprenol L-rhamnosyltransferase